MCKKHEKISSKVKDFAIELHKRSFSLSEDDSKLWRKVIDSELKPGFPDF
jgi:hypothetical protein